MIRSQVDSFKFICCCFFLPAQGSNTIYTAPSQPEKQKRTHFLPAGDKKIKTSGQMKTTLVKMSLRWTAATVTSSADTQSQPEADMYLVPPSKETQLQKSWDAM